MFISQIIFESETENKDVIQMIMDVKRTNVKSAPGLVSSECWWKEDEKTAGFSLVSKWDDKASFINWMRESHKGGHKKPNTREITITKTLNQFEFLE